MHSFIQVALLGHLRLSAEHANTSQSSTKVAIISQTSFAEDVNLFSMWPDQ